MMSDDQTARWYFEAATGERQRYYNLFFHFCRKYKVDWAEATEIEKEFICEVTRVTWEIQEEKLTGVKRNIRPFFAPETEETA